MANNNKSNQRASAQNVQRRGTPLGGTPLTPQSPEDNTDPKLAAAEDVQDESAVAEEPVVEEAPAIEPAVEEPEQEKPAAPEAEIKRDFEPTPTPAPVKVAAAPASNLPPEVQAKLTRMQHYLSVFETYGQKCIALARAKQELSPADQLAMATAHANATALLVQTQSEVMFDCYWNFQVKHINDVMTDTVALVGVTRITDVNLATISRFIYSYFRFYVDKKPGNLDRDALARQGHNVYQLLRMLEVRARTYRKPTVA